MCADCASALALARVRLSALAVAAVMAACGPSAERPATEAVPPAPPRPELAAHEAWARSADSGAMTSVYFTLTNRATVSDTLQGATSAAAEEVGLHMSMQHGNTMHMASVQSLPVPGEDSVLFAPLGAHVMLTRTTRAYAAGDTIALTLTFASGQSLEVRAGVRQP